MAQSILIVKLSSLGDVLHTLPAAQSLRAAFPRAHLAWAVERTHAALVREQPFLDETIEWDRRDARTLFDFVGRLRRRKWDLAIDFQGLFRSGAVTWLSGARRRRGSNLARELATIFYNKRVELPARDRHAVERSLELIAPLGAGWELTPLDRPYLDGRAPATTTPGRRLFPLQPSVAERESVAAWLRAQQVDPRRESLVVLNPHCRREANLWPASQFAELARRLARLAGVRVVLTGGAIAGAVCAHVAASGGPRVLRADGHFSLLGSAVLFSQSAVLVTGDTGPMHLAAAVETPIVALLGATNPIRTGPYASNAIVLHKRLACSPCLAKRCPLHQTPSPCMERISVDEVYEAVLRQLHHDQQGIERRRSA